ncbi:MAG: OmpA family protein [Bacteroidetes bacterium]|nr:OmpA family protein [Bacteroidota bacterium]
MKNFKYSACIITVALLTILCASCKSKKKLVDYQSAATEENTTTSSTAKEQTAQDERPDFNFHAIQFNFNSRSLRPDAIQYLDHIAAEMRMDPSTKFVVNGYASAEGTARHNMTLSINRANAVKKYMVSLGIDGSRLIIKGCGKSDPVAPNTTQSGREKNRRVEVKLAH